MPCSFGVIGKSWLGPRIRRSVAVSSTPPGARASARTVPVTSTDVSCVSPPNASHAASGTSFFESTTCRYPVPSRSITNPIFPDERVVITQPRVITVWPASGGRSSIRWKEGMGSGILVASAGPVNATFRLGSHPTRNNSNPRS